MQKLHLRGHQRTMQCRLPYKGPCLNVISIGLITAAALIPAKPVPSPAPMPAKNVTKSVNKNVMLISISEQLVAKRRWEIRVGDFSSAIMAICFCPETNSCVKNQHISVIFYTIFLSWIIFCHQEYRQLSENSRFVKSSDTQYSTKSKNLQQCHRKQSGSKTRKLIKIKSRF